MADSQNDSPAVQSIDQLEEWFHQGARAPEDWKIGVEYEKPVVDSKTCLAVPYEGPNGIGQLLERLYDRSETWKPVLESEQIIALQDGRASLTLEPGGQFEMSGEQCDSLHCADDELKRHVREILAVGDELGLSFLGLGATPKTPLAELPWMPKQRYRIMREVMKRTGSLGHRMMQQTATVQCNFDFQDEADAAKKMRVSMAMSPLLVGIAANSPVVDGKPSGYKSYRAHIWTDTDADRCGILPFVWSDGSIFRNYTEWALDVPLYFIARGATLIVPEQPTSFRSFMNQGLQGQRATMEDWSLHLTTLFPEVRLKRYIEVRQPDSQSVELMLGTPALMKGILYDADCLDAVDQELKRWGAEETANFREEAARKGLSAGLGSFTLGELAREVVGIAREGLTRQAALNSAGRDETIFLDLLEEDVRNGVCPADRLIEGWEGPWGASVDKLVDATKYRPL